MNKNTQFLVVLEQDGEEEHTSILALVIDDRVELDALIHSGESDTAQTHRMEALRDRFESHPSGQKYFGVVTLYRTGQARPNFDSCDSSDYWPRGQEVALKAVEELYDEVWPEVAENIEAICPRYGQRHQFGGSLDPPLRRARST